MCLPLGSVLLESGTIDQRRIDSGKVGSREYRAIEVLQGAADCGPQDDPLRFLFISVLRDPTS